MSEEHTPTDAATKPRGASRLRGLPFLTVSLHVALIATIFVTRERWQPWVVEQELPDRVYDTSRAVVAPDRRRVLLFRARRDAAKSVIDNDRCIVWDVAKGGAVCTIETDVGVGIFRFAPDGRHIAICEEPPGPGRPRDTRNVTRLRMVSAETGTSLYAFEIPDSVLLMRERLAFSPDGLRFAVDDGRGSVHVRETATGRAVRSLSGRGLGGICYVDWSRDGKRVIAVGEKGALIWETGSDRPATKLSLGRWRPLTRGWGPYGPTFAFDGRHVVLGLYRERYKEVTRADGVRSDMVEAGLGCGVWDAETGEPVAVAEGQCLVAVSPDGKRFITQGRERAGMLPHSLRDTATGAVIAELGRCRSGLWAEAVGRRHSAHFSRDGKRVVAYSHVDRFYDARTGVLLCSIEGPGDLEDGFFLASGNLLLRYVGSRHLVLVQLRDGATGKVLTELSGYTGARPLADRRILADTEDGPSVILVQIRPEWWWGVFWLPHFWASVALAVALVLSVWRDLRRLKRAS
ncbi:MAG: WD40 repeat domain-containing protein [Planctomycetota bacterium]|jgi:dipeptidyl aminopeptidase/acylaminoacyl peptidase